MPWLKVVVGLMATSIYVCCGLSGSDFVIFELDIYYLVAAKCQFESRQLYLEYVW